MILLVHLLFGTAIGSAVNNVWLAIILAFISHYLLDLLPHIEYNIQNIEQKQWHKALPDILRVILDFCLGILLIFILSKNNPIIYICAFFALLPDGLTVFNTLFPNKILEPLQKFHIEKIHFLKENPSTSSGQEKISTFWRISTQVVVIIISIVLFRI
ncbi:MAG: hypothetical protein NTY81_00945 [Candidatus Staskawiczbacteria bacterium]|nr:hypothetical protein [Candidatus Staskawiczbacteria bacterium]